MAFVDIPVTTLLLDKHRRALRRAIPASIIGATGEWYNLFLCSLVAGLVFAKLSFPHSDPLIGVVAAFSTYAAVCMASPVEAAIEAEGTDVARTFALERLDRSGVPARAPGT